MNTQNERTAALDVASGSALLRDALRYRYLRKEISRDHKHHTRTCMEVEKVGWARELGGIGGMWSSLPLTGLALDKAVDAHMRRDLPNNAHQPTRRTDAS